MPVSSLRKIDHVSMGSVLTAPCLSCVPDRNVVLAECFQNLIAFTELDTDSISLFPQGLVHASFFLKILTVCAARVASIIPLAFWILWNIILGW